VTTRFHRVAVLRRQMLTPGMVRLTLGGDDLAGFRSTGVPDEYLRLFFPDPATGQLALPVIDANDRWSYPEGKVCCSTYTVRRFDATANTIDIDFVIHEGGIASDWARKAQPGDSVTINWPRGLYFPPAEAQWQLLVADATGLPALSRILERPPTVPTRVFVEVAEPSHQQPLPAHDNLTVTWLHGGNATPAPSRLGDVVRGIPIPTTIGYIWVAGEQKAVRAIRKYVRQELALPASQYELVGYWVAEHAWEARYEALDPAIKASIDAAWESDRDPEEVQDEVEATLEKLGL
jgi:NADPH-dependent ferric siderophore reductase